MPTAALVGSTGLVGSYILSTLTSLPIFTAVTSFSRRPPKHTSPTLHPIVTTDTSSWIQTLSTLAPPPDIFFSGLGTTRADAGTFEAQWAIDYELNLALAKAAKAAGVPVYVLISAGSANSKSWVPYSKMKGQLDDAVSELGFECTVIVKPGLILGSREKTRLMEQVAMGIAGLAGKVGLKDGFAQDADVIARAAVKAGVEALEGRVPDDRLVGGRGKGKVWKVEQKDIVRMGRDEWEHGK